MYRKMDFATVENGKMMHRTRLKLAKPINEIDIDLEENTLEAEGYIKVVRCKDCKYYWKNNKYKNNTNSIPVCLASPSDNAFCSDGVKNDE